MRKITDKKLEKWIAQFGVNLKRLRKERGYSQIALARESGVSVGYISLVERGKADPSVLILIRLAKGLEIPLSKLF